jgi:hypothetical protein
MPHQIKILVATGLVARACCTAGLAFSLLCLALGALAALSRHGDAGRAGLSRGFVPLTQLADETPRPPVAPSPGQTQPPARGGQPGRTIPTPAGIPAVPSVAPVIPNGVRF